MMTVIEKNACENLDNVRQNVTSRILIDKDNSIVGKIVTRYGKNTAYTTMVLDGSFVGYAKCSGYGYSLEGSNIDRIVMDNKDKFVEMGYTNFNNIRGNGIEFFYDNGVKDYNAI